MVESRVSIGYGWMLTEENYRNSPLTYPDGYEDYIDRDELQ